MHMLFRMISHLLIHGRRAPKIGFDEVSISRFRVTPTDLDIMNHVNNGKYLSIMDIARQTLVLQMGVDRVLKREGWAPVVAASTISYRKSLQPWMKFTIESRIIGLDDQAIYIEQRFVVPDQLGTNELYARAYVRGRFVKRAGGVVQIDDLVEQLGIDPSRFELPEEVAAWGRLSRLPSTRVPAPSHWA